MEHVTGVFNANELDQRAWGNEWEYGGFIDPYWESLTDAQKEEHEDWESDEFLFGVTRCRYNDKRVMFKYTADNGRNLYYRPADDAEYAGRYNANGNTIQVVWSKWGMKGRWASPCYPNQATPAKKGEGGVPMYSYPPEFFSGEYEVYEIEGDDAK